MRSRLSGVVIVFCMALLLLMAGTSWGANEGPPVCLKKGSEIENTEGANFLHGNWATLITDTDDGILETMLRLQYGQELRFFRHRFEAGEPFGQPTLNFMHNRFCNVVTDLRDEISQAFGFPLGTTYVFKKTGVRRGEVVPDEQGYVGSNTNTPVGDIEGLLIPESIFPLHYASIYVLELYKQPPTSGGGGEQQQTLTVTIAGSGSGVVSDGGTLICSGICSQAYDFNSSVTLTATPNSGSTFMGWSVVSGCSGTSVCVVTMDQAQSVSATFSLQPSTSTPVTVTFQDGVAGYGGTVDTFLLASTPNNTQGASTKNEWDTNELKYALLRFENIFGSEPGQIPVGATIQSASLTLQVLDPGNPADVYEVAVTWSEVETFNGFGGEPDVQADELGNLVSAAGGQVNVGPYTVDVTSSLSAWANNPGSNQGWIFVPTGSNGVDLRSRESSAVATRPQLAVTYIH